MTKKPILKQPFFQMLWGVFERLIQPFLGSFLPRPHYLEGEKIQQIIRMAPYRAELPKIFGVMGMLLLIPSVLVLVIMLALGSPASTAADIVTGEVSTTGTSFLEIFAGGIAIVAIILLYQAAEGWLSYHQWQFILTDKRIILITPDPQRQGFADAIYLKRGKIQVLDTNFSRSPIWGLFQIIRGTRDVMLSMGGYEFFEQGAQVKGGLRFPDVTPEDIKRLEELIFGG